jgi:toxin ParE1/3/4
MVKINWTPVSLEDLKNIFDYISEDSNRYAQITVNKIYLRVSSLTKQPYSGRIVPEFNDKNIREIIDGNYRIVHEIINDYQIDILRIFHSARILKKKNIK